MNSPGAGPRQASTKAAVSRTERDWQPWIDTSPVRSDRCGASENTPRETLSPILPLTPGRNADRAAAVGGMRDRDGARRDHRGAAGRRAAGGVVGVPGVARDVDGGIVRRAADSEFRRGRPADQVESGLAHLRCQERIGGGAIAAHQQRAHFLQAALHRRAEILHQERQAGKGPVEIGAVLAGIGDRVLEDFDHARQRRIDLGDAGGRLRWPVPRPSVRPSRRARPAPRRRGAAHSSQLIGKFMQSVPPKIVRTLKHDRGGGGTAFSPGRRPVHRDVSDGR